MSKRIIDSVVLYGTHACALTGIVLGQTTFAALAVCFVFLYVTGSIGICVGYHRLLTHRGFEIAKPLEYAIALVGQLAWQGDPIEWVATHRKHHARSDEPGDPHSPLQGFAWSHVLWLLLPNDARPTLEEQARLASDLYADPFYRRTRYAWIPLQGMLAAALLMTFGWPGVVWGIFVRLVLTYHCTWMVNSVTHTFGYRSYPTGDRSTNNLMVAIVTWGEGWHNNHHAFPASPRHGLGKSELDLAWLTIKLAFRLGIVRKLALPSEAQMERAKMRSLA